MLFYRESWFTQLGPMGSALESLGGVLEDIQSFQEETLLHSLEDTFDPMEDFVKREVKTIRKVSERKRSVYLAIPIYFFCRLFCQHRACLYTGTKKKAIPVLYVCKKLLIFQPTLCPDPCSVA